MKNKALLSIVTLLLIVIGVLGVSLLSKNDEGDDNQTTTSELVESDPVSTSSPAEDLPDPETVRKIMQEKLQRVTGINEGVAVAIQSSLSFPQSTLEITEDQTFNLNAGGFDLALLGNKNLAIEEGIYPQAKIIASGQLEIDGGDAFMNIDTLTPEFYIVDGDGQEQSLGAEVQAQLLGSIRAAQIEIPIVSKASPITIPVDIRDLIQDGFEIESTEDAEDFYFAFSTSS